MMYAIYLPVVYFLARRRTGFRWSERVTTQLSFLVVAYGLVFCLTKWSELVAAISGMGLAIIFGLYGVARLGNMANLSGPVKKNVELLSSLFTTLGIRV